MTGKSETTVTVTHEEAVAAAKAWFTLETEAWLDSLTDEDIAAQIAANPDAAPELDDDWFKRARLVIPLSSVAAE
ncbi:MAG: hypothetical protein WA906_06470 [Pacificimonas sp.]